MTPRARLFALSALLLAALPLTALAQAWPARSIRLICPFPPGGGTDVVSRLVAEKLGAALNGSVIVDNKPGAGGNLGLDQVAKAAPDGYTLGMGQTSNLAINPTLYSSLPFNPLKDFAPVALVASQPMVLVVGANSPYKTLAQLVEAARAKPGSLTMASAGTGTVGHLGGEMFAKRAGIKFLHVPYKGASAALTDVASGEVTLNFPTPPSALPLLRGGKLRALAVTSAQRLPNMPEVPTVAELGYKDFVAEDWKGFVAPAGTPPAIITRLNGLINDALKRPEIRARLADEGSKPLGGTPQDFAALLKVEYPRWGAAVRDSGAKVE